MSLKHERTISVIIPVRNRPAELTECLRSLQQSSPAPYDIIIVDDASTDNTPDIAEQLGAKVIRLTTNHDPNFCRNCGAEMAGGDILLFLDSDVIIQQNTLAETIRAFEDPNIDAIVGLYTVKHRHKEISSQYKNLWIRYSYLRSNAELDWIFGAIAAIRKDTFWKAGGFDKSLFMKYGGEDLELGKRMNKSQHIIRLNPAVEVEHLKRHTLLSLLKNDFERSQGFVQLAGKLGQLTKSITHGFVNVYPNFAYSVPLAWMIALSALGSAFFSVFVWLLLLGGLLYIFMNASFLVYYAQQRGLFETIQVLGILFLDHLTCGLGSFKGLLQWLSIRSKTTD